MEFLAELTNREVLNEVVLGTANVFERPACGRAVDLQVEGATEVSRISITEVSAWGLGETGATMGTGKSTGGSCSIVDAGLVVGVTVSTLSLFSRISFLDLRPAFSGFGISGVHVGGAEAMRIALDAVGRDFLSSLSCTDFKTSLVIDDKLTTIICLSFKSSTSPITCERSKHIDEKFSAMVTLVSMLVLLPVVAAVVVVVVVVEFWRFEVKFACGFENDLLPGFARMFSKLVEFFMS